MRIPGRPLLLAALLLAAGPASAQGFQPAPSQGFGAHPQQRPQEPPCFKDFIALRDEAQKHGKAVQAAGQRKVPPQEACRLFNNLVGAEVKLIKFIEENAKWCGIPAQVLTQMKEQHGKITQIRTRVCQVAAQPARPAGPSLSDALGTSRLPDSSNIRTGHGGTFNTLTGTPLGQK